MGLKLKILVKYITIFSFKLDFMSVVTNLTLDRGAVCIAVGMERE